LLFFFGWAFLNFFLILSEFFFVVGTIAIFGHVSIHRSISYNNNNNNNNNRDVSIRITHKSGELSTNPCCILLTPAKLFKQNNRELWLLACQPTRKWVDILFFFFVCFFIQSENGSSFSPLQCGLLVKSRANKVIFLFRKQFQIDTRLNSNSFQRETKNVYFFFFFKTRLYNSSTFSLSAAAYFYISKELSRSDDEKWLASGRYVP
jgi:hypothetical protein